MSKVLKLTEIYETVIISRLKLLLNRHWILLGKYYYN